MIADVELGVIDRLASRGDRELGEAAHAPCLLEVRPVRRVKALHLRRDAHLELGGVELRDRAHPGNATDQVRQNASTSSPIGVTAPSPVVTARRAGSCWLTNPSDAR